MNGITKQCALASTWLEVLRLRADQTPSRVAFRSIASSGAEKEVTDEQLLFAAARVATQLQDKGVKAGDRVLIFCPPGLSFVAALFGTMAAGAIAVPCYPPRFSGAVERLRPVVENAKPVAAIAAAELVEASTKVESHVSSNASPTWTALRWLALSEEDVLSAQPSELLLSEGNNSSPAILQYTSGSTSTPKGVCLSQGNLLENSRLISQLLPEGSQAVSWLPPYHDMGLIGFIFTPLLAGIETSLMSPDTFLRRPLRWLEAMSRFRAVTSAGPDSAYALCVRRITDAQKEGLDLSNWRMAFNGAERVRRSTLEQFAKAFECCGFDPGAFAPCYGLAEATLCVSSHRPGGISRMIDAQVEALSGGLLQDKGGDAPGGGPQIVSCGTPLSGVELSIVNPGTGRRCAPGEIGEIWVSGSSIAGGYFRKPRQSKEVFENSLEGDGRRYLRTGDLGTLLDGELFVTGRVKELIVLGGKNYHPEDLESAVAAAHSTFLPNCGVVFSVDDGRREEVVLVQEVVGRNLEEATTAVEAAKSALLRSFGLNLSVVLLVARGKLPRTTSGKLRRRRARQQFEADEVVAFFDSRTVTSLETVNAPPELQARLSHVVETLLEITEVAPDEDFFSLGVQSLVATQLVAKIREEFRVELPLRLVFEQPTVRQLASEIAKLGPTTDLGPTGPAPKGSPMELTASQERMWFLYQLDPLGSAYNVAGSLQLSGELRLDWLENALQSVWSRHDILHSVYKSSASGPLMKVRKQRSMELSIIGREEPLTRQQATDFGSLMAQAPFDLERGPLWRVEAYVLKNSGDENNRNVAYECVLAVCLHHIVADGWSLNVLMDEIIECYLALSQSRSPRLPSLVVQYADYAHWHRRALRSGLLDSQVEYWKERLKGVPELTELPTDFPRPALHQQKGSLVHYPLSEGLSAELVEFASRKRVTPFIVLLSVFQLLIRNYTKATDIVVGTPIANRRFRAAEELVGTLVNTIVLRGDLSKDVSFSEYLAEVKRTTLDAFANQDLPFEQLVEILRVPRHADRTPLFQIMFDHQVFDIPEGEVAGIRFRAEPVEKEGTQVDLGLSVIRMGERFEIAAGYRIDLFTKQTIVRLCANFECLLASAIENESKKIFELTWLAPPELNAVVASSHGALTEIETDTVVASILAWTVKEPSSLAVTCGDSSLSYGELGHRSATLARELSELGVGPGSLVGVCLNRSIELVVALLGIWRSGACYVPIDPSYPKDRIGMMCEDAQLSSLLGQPELEHLWRDLELGCPILMREGSSTSPSLEATGRGAPPLSHMAKKEGLAYVMFTSGSTGRPKGVQVTHSNVANFIQSMGSSLGMQASDRVVAVTTIAFDISVLELFLPLANGALVDILPREVSIDSQKLQVRLAKTDPTLMQATPATWRLLLDGAWQGSEKLTILCGGEALSGELAQQLVPRCLRLWNVYGPTETTVWSTMAEIVDGKAPISIGRPIENTFCYVLDERGRKVPFGVVGELFIGGAGVTQGYIGRDDLTSERFLDDPFIAKSDTAQARMYRTGDLVKRRADGELLFWGRSDSQVKIRGYRIELGEIESRLACHDDVASCVVVQSEFGPNDSRLVAYFIPESHSPSTKDLKGFLLKSLPQYMIPSHFVELETFPLTPNGKVDRKALPKVVIEVQPSVAAGEGSPTVQLVAEVWGALLNAHPKSDDDFFEMGGHSLLVVQMLGEIAKRSGVRLPVNALFSASKLASLAQLVDEGRERLASIVVPLSSASVVSSGESEGTRVYWIHSDEKSLSDGQSEQGALRRRLRSTWGVHIPEYSMRMDGDFAHLASLAGEYLGALKVHAGDSEFGSGEAGKPKLLVASGYGGNIALEMATQLKELGVANTRVLLLDTAFPKKRSSLRLGRSGTSQAASELPPTYAALSDAERIAWLSHRMGAIPGHVSAIVSEGFRAATLKAGLRCELPQLRPVLCSGENFVEVPDKILASLKSEFFQESR